MKRTIYLSLFLLPCLLHAQLTGLKQGMTITQSVKVLSKTYYLNNMVGQMNPVIEIEGNNIVVDFNNAELDGNIKGDLPDKFTGIAIHIKSGKNITIKNLAARGYKIALLAKGIEGLTIEHCDFSYNYRQHLNSTQQKEDLSDWMSYHHNEKDEWLRYGAAMYLRGCDKAIIHDNIVTGGQCGLMLTQCNDGLIYNNNISFNSGIGIGMYRSSGNKIMYNKLDFNVRGHSEGVYNRGQDSAAILVFEQCNNNVYAFNSATHSGDGFFLWAGQTTMDTGIGGCNDNLIFKNDFSYAPTNGVEVTFSRNRMSANQLIECDNGIWGGYSYNSDMIYNDIRNCKMGIAIEHGQDNKIEFNKIYNCNIAIKLWARASQPADWGYANKRDTKSRNYDIGYNSFRENKTVFDFVRTNKISGIKNDTTRNNIFLKSDTTVKDISVAGFVVYTDAFEPATEQERKIVKMKLPWKEHLIDPDSSLNGRRNIHITEWGPYDFHSPFIWNTNPVDKSDTLKFEIIGPKGNWKLVNQRGVKNISLSSGTIPAVLYAIKTNEEGQDVFIELEYTGESIVNPFGKKIVKGKPWRFSYSNNILPVDWSINWYAFDSIHNPVKNPAMIAELVKQAPILQEQTKEMNYAWWGGIGKEKKQEQFLTIAEADVELPPGEYEFVVSWDDAVRLYVDGKLILDEWNPSKYIFDESPNRQVSLYLDGKHHLKVEHAELGGFATLIVKLKKK